MTPSRQKQRQTDTILLRYPTKLPDPIMTNVRKNKTAADITGRKTGNAMAINFIDRSRKIAGDRWQVELVGEMEIPIPQNFWTAVKENDVDLLDCIRKKLGDRLPFSISRIRNFVADDEKEAIRNELISRFEENIAPYMDKPDFVRKLFLKKFKEARQKCISDRYAAPHDAQPAEEDEGTADFSDLFK
jgi:hypothetical protein